MSEKWLVEGSRYGRAWVHKMVKETARTFTIETTEFRRRATRRITKTDTMVVKDTREQAELAKSLYEAAYESFQDRDRELREQLHELAKQRGEACRKALGL